MRAPNLIHGLTLDVAYDGDGETGESLAGWLRAVLLPVVDSVLAAQDRQGQVCRIERLEIDLGTVSRDHAEDELARLLQAQLADALRWQLAHAPVQADEVAPAPAADGGHDAGVQLMQFLRSGRLPWAIAADPQTAHEQLLRQVLAMPSAARVLQSVVQDQQMLTRLVRQYNAAMLHEVTAALYPHRPVQQAPGDAPEAFWLKVLQPEAPGTALQPPDPALSQFRDWKQRKRDLPEQGLSLAELQQWLIWWLMHDSTLVNQDCSLMLASIKQQCAQAREPERFMRLVLAALRDGVPLDLDALASQASQPPSQLQPAAPMDAITSLRSQQAIRNFIAQQALEHEELGNLNSAQLHQLVRGWIGGTSSVFLSAIESHALQAPDAHAYFRRILTKLLDGQPIDLEALAAPVDATRPVAPPAAAHANAVAAGIQPATVTRANAVSAAATTIAASPAESASSPAISTAAAPHRSVSAPAAMSARDPVAVAVLAGTGPAEGASAAATETAAPPAESASSPARSVATTPVEAASAVVAPAGSPFALAASTAASLAESVSSPAISTAAAPHGGVSAAVTAAATGPVVDALAASPAEAGTQAENPSLVATPAAMGPAGGASAAAAMSARDPVAVAALAGTGPAEGASAAATEAAAPPAESASSPARSVAPTPVEAASAAVAPAGSPFALAASTAASPAESVSSPAISTATAPHGGVSAAVTAAATGLVVGALAASPAEAGTQAENPSLVATPAAMGPAGGASAAAAAPAAMSARDPVAVAALAGTGPAEGASAAATEAAAPPAESASSSAISTATAPHAGVSAAVTVAAIGAVGGAPAPAAAEAGTLAGNRSVVATPAAMGPVGGAAAPAAMSARDPVAVAVLAGTGPAEGASAAAIKAAAPPAESASSPTVPTATAPHGGISAVASSGAVTPADGASVLPALATAKPAAPAPADAQIAALAPPVVVSAVAEIARPSQPDYPMQQRSRPAGAPSPLPALLQQSLPQRLASALLQADLRSLEMYWPEITRHHADILAAAAQRYLRRPQERAQLVAHSPPDLLVEMIIAIAPKTGAVVKTVLRQAEACNAVLPQPLTAEEFQQRVLNFAFHQALDGGQGGTILDLIAATQGAVDMAQQVAYAWRVILPPMPDLEQLLFGARYLQILRAEGDDMAPSLQVLLADEVCTRYPELLDPQQLERLAVTGSAGRLNGADVQMPEQACAAGAVAARSASRRPAAEPEAMLAILLMRAEPLGQVDHIAAELLLQRLLRAADVALSGALETALSQPAAIARLAGLAPAPVLAQLLVRLQPALAAQLPAILRAVAAKTSVNQVPAMLPRSIWRAVYHAAFVAADPVTPAEFIRTLMCELGGGEVAPPQPAPAAAPQDIMKSLLRPIAARPAERPETIQAVDEDSAGESNIRNAGMVIIATYAQRLFSILELTKDGQFISEEAAQRAVHLLQYAITGASATPEYQLTLNKLLCGIHGGKPIARGIDITDKEKDTIEQMLNGVIAHWKALGKTSIAGLRQTFLQREGRLHFEDEAWRLHIPSATFDMLLDRLPWSFAMIKFPWMEHPLQVTWR